MTPVEVLTRENEQLIQQVQHLKREVSYKDRVLRDKNVALDALYYVWCDGGCHSGVCRYRHPPLTEEMVHAAERNTARLRRWWTNALAKDQREILSGP